jgi:hypothetical protein
VRALGRLQTSLSLLEHNANFVRSMYDRASDPDTVDSAICQLPYRGDIAVVIASSALVTS